MKEEIETTLKRSVCTGWDRGFLESVLSQIERGRTLSDKQIATTEKVINRNGIDAQLIHDEWESVYAAEHKDEALVLARYYKRTGYFSELVQDIFDDIVPDMRAYLKMSGNKYAQGVLRTHYQEPKYPVGALVAPRANCGTSSVLLEEATIANYAQYRFAAAKSFQTKGGLILAVTNIISSHAKGAKTYKILPIGSTIPVIVEERYIKIKRK